MRQCAANNGTQHYRKYHNNAINERNPNFLIAYYYEFYTGPLWEVIKSRKSSGYKIQNNIGFICTWILTYILLPCYLLTRIFNILMPLFIVLYLYFDGNGIILFVDIEIFQVIMWSIYVCLLIIWFILLYFILREEYVLWHLLPNTLKLVGCDADNVDKYDAMDTLIKKQYFDVTEYPFIEEIVVNVFGVDIANDAMDENHNFT